jgi:poly-gamma-glutamate capsule biosynthesis protein CapA/YwtB (metallophosphatase superfamily)
VTVKLALAGDTMLGRGVAEKLSSSRPGALFSEEVVETARSADLFVLNLECCISERGRRWQAPDKPFFFRAPPAAIHVLREIGVDCVTLANNHALDYGHDALLDTFDYLSSAGIKVVGAGRNLDEARAPGLLTADGFRLAVVAFTDHPADFAATPDRGGVALTDMRSGPPDWLLKSLSEAAGDAVLVSPHWGPNMTTEPDSRIRSAASSLLSAGASLIAGHSAHVFHGVGDRVVYDLGDFIDDYAVDPALRNDLGMLFTVTLDERGPAEVEAMPLKLDYCYTRAADEDEAAWIRSRFTAACRALGTDVGERNGRLVVSFR